MQNTQELGNFILQMEGNPVILVKDDQQYKFYKNGSTITLDQAKNEGLFSDEEVEKIGYLFNRDFSGDIILFPNYDDDSVGYDFIATGSAGSAIYCGFTKGIFCSSLPDRYLSSDHGNINLNDRQISFVICGNGVNQSIITEAKNQVDIAHTIADILEFSMTGEGTEGYGKSIFK